LFLFDKRKEEKKEGAEETEGDEPWKGGTSSGIEKY